MFSKTFCSFVWALALRIQTWQIEFRALLIIVAHLSWLTWPCTIIGTSYCKKSTLLLAYFEKPSRHILQRYSLFFYTWLPGHNEKLWFLHKKWPMNMQFSVQQGLKLFFNGRMNLNTMTVQDSKWQRIWIAAKSID